MTISCHSPLCVCFGVIGVSQLSADFSHQCVWPHHALLYVQVSQDNRLVTKTLDPLASLFHWGCTGRSFQSHNLLQKQSREPINSMLALSTLSDGNMMNMCLECCNDDRNVVLHIDTMLCVRWFKTVRVLWSVRSVLWNKNPQSWWQKKI